MLNYNSSTCHGIQDKSTVFYLLAKSKYSHFETIKSIQNLLKKIILFECSIRREKITERNIKLKEK